MIKLPDNISTPAYIADIGKIKANMRVAARLKNEAGCSIVLATKAFAMPRVFDVMRETLDGTTASGLFEARMGAEHFGKDVHTYSPAYDEVELRKVLKYSKHIYFNSVSQLERFRPLVKQERPEALIGLRINPGISLVKNSALYDPSSPRSRFGIPPDKLTEDVLNKIDILHVHNLCENMAADSVVLINHITKQFPDALKKLNYINFGGGHYITHPDYNLDTLITAIRNLSQKFDIHVTLEPGGALVYNAGYLVTRVLDVIDHDDHKIAILDTSASAHMPDVLEVPYRPPLMHSGQPGEKAHTYSLGGKTCMTGDVIGKYSFDVPLKIGDLLIFEDMMQYSFVKNTSFNGMPLPDLARLEEDGTYTVLKKFGYEDFLDRLG